MNLIKLLTGATVALALCCTPVFAKDWGLSYPQDGAVPIGNETSEYLNKFDAYYVAPTEEKVIYLTFDAGYENGCTEKILDALKKHEAPATFFLLGTYIRDNPEMINRMLAEGHIVANHTMTHSNMSSASAEKFSKELTTVEEEFLQITGKELPKFYRPPEGKYSEANLQQAKDMGYKTVFWSLAYVDWVDNDQPSKEKAFARLLPRIHPGAIILLHNTSKTNEIIMDELLARYKNLGYRFGSLEEL